MLDDFSSEQAIVYKILKNSIVNDKCSHAYLINTNGYSKGLDLAKSFAKYLLCPLNKTNNQECVNCNQCHLIDENAFSDFKVIESDGLWIKKEQTDELLSDFSFKSVNSNKMVYIINGAHCLNASAANSILKFLEEPCDGIVAVLVTDNIYKVLNTIVSRCQVINLNSVLDKSSDMLVNVANYLYDDSGKVNAFVTDNSSFSMISHVIDFLVYLRNNKLDTIVYIDKLWNCFFVSKDDFLFAFDIMVLFFNDVINFKLNRDIILSSFSSNVSDFSVYNFFDINNFLSLIMDIKSDLYSNVNVGLLLDKFIIKMEEIV